MSGRAPLVIVTGPSGAGKSTVCRRVVDLARSHGITTGGIVTERRGAGRGVASGPSSMSGGGDRGGRPKAGESPSAGLDVVDVATNERRPLAEFDRPTGGPTTGRWHFHPSALIFGLAGCARVHPEALLVIDELGPLELVQHEGWAPLVPLLYAHIGPALVVVRPSLIVPFLVLAEGRHPDTIEVTPAGREALPPIIFARLGLDL